MRSVSRAVLSLHPNEDSIDETRPSCTRCQRSNIACPGYRETSFISYEAGESGLHRLKDARCVPEDGPRASFSQLLTPVNSHFIPWPQDDVCISYARAHLPRIWRDASQWQIVPTTGPSGNPRIRDNVVPLILISLARTLFAYRFRQHHLLWEGFTLYGEAVSKLQQALSQLESSQRLETLKAVLALRAFDSFVPGHVGAWVQHSLGVERILEVRGPQAHRDAASRELLEHARPLIVLACLRERKSTILAREEWKTVPWSEEGTNKSPVQFLMDIFVDLPTALYGGAADSRGSELPARVVDTTQAQVILILRRLQMWRLDWAREIHQQVFEIDNNLPVELDIQSPWPKGIGFSSLEHAKAFALSCAVCLMAVNAAFSQELEALHCTQCIQQETMSTIDHLLRRQSLVDCAVENIDAVELYHSTMAGACGLVSYYFTHAPSEPQPIEILISLRHVWLVTRRLDCPRAIWFDKTMQKILNYSAAGLPLFLHV